MTEKLLLYGGAIHAAGAVKSRKAKRSAVSDWMALEKQRGISVTTSVLQFEYDDVRWNLLDTPGHNDFSEDTYRTLMAADCGIMILDAARGVEQQTRKLFHVCRMRNTPVVTFINKMDRPARDAFALMSEVEDVLGVSTVPFTWPIGSGDLFQGVYDRINKLVIRFERSAEGHSKRAEMKVTGLDDPELDAATKWSFSTAPVRSGTKNDFSLGKSRPSSSGAHSRISVSNRSFTRSRACVLPRANARRPAASLSAPAMIASAHSSSKCRRTWTRRTATASLLRVFAPANSREACVCTTSGSARRFGSTVPSSSSLNSERV
ncbi:MAG: GTP-binding protein [Deltaproteobacteria bacterium]|nr:GTP-binding protein [Deltaproteobacteria bacterium]